MCRSSKREIQEEPSQEKEGEGTNYGSRLPHILGAEVFQNLLPPLSAVRIYQK